ncbi:MAG: ankyrin repeat domain-containing protein [Bacteroidota bacterium]
MFNFIKNIIFFLILSLVYFQSFSQVTKNEEKFITYAAKGDIEKVENFVKKVVNIDVKNKGRWTALAYASKYGHIEVVMFLIDQGAEVNLTVNTGSTPFQIAVQHNQMEIANYLITKDADVNHKDITGMSSLAWASKNGDIKMIEFLIDKGADVNSVNINARSVLDHATSPEVISLLKSYGAKKSNEMLSD